MNRILDFIGGRVRSWRDGVNREKIQKLWMRQTTATQQKIVNFDFGLLQDCQCPVTII